MQLQGSAFGISTYAIGEQITETNNAMLLKFSCLLHKFHGNQGVARWTTVMARSLHRKFTPISALRVRT